ncbi:unnamed protein product, partial [Ixodes persulcatus]
HFPSIAYLEPRCLLEYLVAVAAIFATIAAATVWLQTRPQRKRVLPPGPRGTPLLGFLPFLGKNLHVMFRDLAKVYGPVVRQVCNPFTHTIKVGTANIVALNSYDSIKNGLSNNAIQGRSRSVFLDQSKSPGVATLNGKVWLENRQMCLKLLRELGMGKTCLDEKIRDEVRCLLSQISELKGEPVFISKYTTPSISNNITGLLFGRRYDYDDPRRTYLDENMDGAGRALSSGSLVMFLPTWVYTIGAHLPFTRIYAIRRCFANIVNFTK